MCKASTRNWLCPMFSPVCCTTIAGLREKNRVMDKNRGCEARALLPRDKNTHNPPFGIAPPCASNVSVCRGEVAKTKKRVCANRTGCRPKGGCRLTGYYIISPRYRSRTSSQGCGLRNNTTPKGDGCVPKTTVLYPTGCISLGGGEGGGSGGRHMLRSYS